MGYSGKLLGKMYVFERILFFWFVYFKESRNKMTRILGVAIRVAFIGAHHAHGGFISVRFIRALDDYSARST